MSRRNPLNERYQTDSTSAGKTRRSAASAKPVMKAAASVYVKDPKSKPKEGMFQRMFSGAEKRREEDIKAREKASGSVNTEGLSKEERKELREKFMTTNEREYRKWRRIWWVFIALGIGSLVPPIIFAAYFLQNETLTMAFYGLGWAFLLIAIGIDIVKIRPIRKEARGELVRDKSKAATRARKEARQEQMRREEEAARMRAEKKAQKQAKQERKEAKKNS